MAGIGLSKPYVALYEVNNGVISYSGGAFVGKAVSLDLSLDTPSDNILYGDNGPAETDNQFAGGQFTLTTTDLDPDVMGQILGITPVALTIPGLETDDATELIFDDDQDTPYVGFGAIKKRMIDGEIKWVGVVYPKVQFVNPNEALDTQGDSISWQTPEIVANILRDDSEKHRWKRQSSFLDTEADALLYIQTVLGGGSGSE